MFLAGGHLIYWGPSERTRREGVCSHPKPSMYPWGDWSQVGKDPAQGHTGRRCWPNLGVNTGLQTPRPACYRVPESPEDLVKNRENWARSKLSPLGQGHSLSSPELKWGLKNQGVYSGGGLRALQGYMPEPVRFSKQANKSKVPGEI